MNEPGRISTGAAATRSELRTAALVAVIIAALIAVGLFGPIRYVFLGSEILIAILYASSLNLLMGYGGMLSFGHAAYYALAAYTSGLLLIRLNWPAEVAMAAGPIVAAAGALVFGFFIIRSNRGGPASFLMLTLAFSQLVFAILYKWYDITRGDDGISGIDAPGTLGDPRHYFLFVIAVFVVCMVLLARIKSSPFGITLQAIRDNQERAAFAGIATRRYQLLAFVIAGAFAGVAGTLYAFFSGTISPQLADWTASARPFLANTMGGIHSFWGPVVGVVVFELMDSQIARFTEHSLLAVGVLSIVVGVFLPEGLVGLAHRILRRRPEAAKRI